MYETGSVTPSSSWNLRINSSLAPPQKNVHVYFEVISNPQKGHRNKHSCVNPGTGWSCPSLHPQHRLETEAPSSSDPVTHCPPGLQSTELPKATLRDHRALPVCSHAADPGHVPQAAAALPVPAPPRPECRGLRW